MAQKDRLESIRSIVKAERRVVVSELSKQFDVTEETIRRDLEKLEGEGLVTRTYGGAVLMHPVNADVRISYMRRTQINVEEKQAIARIAVRQLPQHGAAIGADSSSTVREAIRLLSDREDLLLMNIEGETLESYYPGLAALATEQLVAKAPMMSSVVNEIVLVQCASEEDAAAAADILQERADAQAEGGAWYPESMETWSNAQVIREGTYAALIASSQYQEQLASSFREQFA